ncbi:MAG: LysR family transcriptional regulator [Myxococcota bacterium]
MTDLDRRLRTSRVWNWLPQFRAVAETQHLPTAAARVHVTPPALSRTLKLLEEELGHALFHRRAGRLVLTEDGRTLLEAVRIAMRTVEDAGSHLGDPTLAGPVWVAAGGVSQPMALSALLRLRARWPALEPRLLTPDPDRVIDQLWSGELDLAVGSFHRAAKGIRTELLGHERSSVYCGPGHALYGRTEVGLDEVVQWPFTSPPPDASGASPEGWPADVPREVVFVVDRIALGVEICASTGLLAVLPDSLARASRVPLHRLPLGDLVPLTPIVVHHPEPATPGGVVESLIAELRREVARPAGPPPSGDRTDRVA